jgi:hypothetical protein
VNPIVALTTAITDRHDEPARIPSTNAAGCVAPARTAAARRAATTRP